MADKTRNFAWTADETLQDKAIVATVKHEASGADAATAAPLIAKYEAGQVLDPATEWPVLEGLFWKMVGDKLVFPAVTNYDRQQAVAGIVPTTSIGDVAVS